MVLPLGDSEKTCITPIVTYSLIGLNVVVYLLQLVEGPRFTTAYAATPWEIFHAIDLPAGLPELEEQGIAQSTAVLPIWMTMLTSLFLHGSPLHVAGNMLYLWIFGDNVEEVLGALRYLAVYLACGLLGTLVQMTLDPTSLVPIFGASGSVAGVMGAYLIWFPNHRVRVLFIRVVVEIPALWVIGSWIALQAVRGLAEQGVTSGVAYAAHLGGALLGIAVGLTFRDRARPFETPAWARLRRSSAVEPETEPEP